MNVLFSVALNYANVRHASGCFTCEWSAVFDLMDRQCTHKGITEPLRAGEDGVPIVKRNYVCDFWQERREE